MSKKKILLIFSSILAFALIVCIVLATLLYNGIILLNNPSLEEFPVRGVDVSSYQGEIDWNVLSKENVSFAFIKSTEGSTHVDRYFENNLNNALKTNLKVGAYHLVSSYFFVISIDFNINQMTASKLENKIVEKLRKEYEKNI